MKRIYIKPAFTSVVIKPFAMMTDSFTKEELGGGSGDGQGAVVNSLDADFGEEDFEEIVYN